MAKIESFTQLKCIWNQIQVKMDELEEESIKLNERIIAKHLNGLLNQLPRTAIEVRQEIFDKITRT